jgi:methylated-DNA-[protein]-cysteine S-methyltransferase
MGDPSYAIMESPIGALGVRADDGGLRAIEFLERGGRASRAPRHLTAPLRDAVDQIRAYFAGELREFTLPLAPAGSRLQQVVWRSMCAVPYGATISYGELARRLGRPGAARAIGAACARNPLPIAIPCHRVIGSDGRLTGYAGGIDAKRRLLALERMAPTRC